MKRTLLGGLIVAALAALLLPAAAAATEVATRFNLGLDDKYRYHPDVCGALVVFQQKDGTHWNVYRSAPVQPICSAAGDQILPALSSPYAVWEDHRNGNGDIYGYDFGTDTVFPICTDPHEQRRPRIDGDWVVWQDERHGSWDIYGYDLATHTEAPICVEAHDQTWPDVCGDLVVWVDRRYGDKDIIAYDRAADFEFPVCLDTADQDQPSVSDRFVVWRDLRDASETGADIWAFDLTTSLERPVCQVAAEQKEPRVAADLVVWSDARSVLLGNSWNVYGADLTTGDELALAAAAGWQGQPAIDGWRTVWADSRNSKYVRIFGADLTPWTTRLRINDGAAWTNSAKVKLNPYARGKAGIVTQMMLWNEGAVGVWEAYTTTKSPWYLAAGDGPKTVHALFQDIGANISPSASASITLDTHGPTCKVPTAVSVAQGGRGSIGYRVDDNLAPKAKVTIRVKRSGATVLILILGKRVTGKLLHQPFLCDLAPGTYKIAVYAQDLAGNDQSKVGTNTLTVRP